MNIRVVNNRSDAMHFDEFLKILNFTVVLTLVTKSVAPGYWASLEAGDDDVYLVTDGILEDLRGFSYSTRDGAIKKLVAKVSKRELKIVGKIPRCFTAPKLMFGDE